MGCYTKLKVSSLHYNLHITGGSIVKCMPFSRVLMFFNMQITSFRIWTRVNVPISYDACPNITTIFVAICLQGTSLHHRLKILFPAEILWKSQTSGNQRGTDLKDAAAVYNKIQWWFWLVLLQFEAWHCPGETQQPIFGKTRSLYTIVHTLSKEIPSCSEMFSTVTPLSVKMSALTEYTISGVLVIARLPCLLLSSILYQPSLNKHGYP